AIVGNPSAILADEPTAALDSENGQAIMDVLARIARDPSRSVLVVTHDPRIVPFADRIVRIEDGCIVGEERHGGGRRVAPQRRADEKRSVADGRATGRPQWAPGWRSESAS